MINWRTSMFCWRVTVFISMNVIQSIRNPYADNHVSIDCVRVSSGYWPLHQRAEISRELTATGWTSNSRISKRTSEESIIGKNKKPTIFNNIKHQSRDQSYGVCYSLMFGHFVVIFSMFNLLDVWLFRGLMMTIFHSQYQYNICLITQLHPQIISIDIFFDNII